MMILKIYNFDVEAAIKSVQVLIETDEALILALKAAIDMLLLLVKLVTNKKGLNSKKSSGQACATVMLVQININTSTTKSVPKTAHFSWGGSGFTEITHWVHQFATKYRSALPQSFQL